MRIVSLVPHATELLFALGLGPTRSWRSRTSATTRARRCERPKVTRDVLPAGLSAGEIDAAVRERTLQGEAIYELDRETLRELEPDLIVTQELCPVCAVSYDEVAALAKELPSRPRVIALDPKTLGETLGDVRTLAQATDSRDRGVELIAEAAGRIDRVKLAVRGQPRPRVAALEWLDPVYVAGHWTPQLIELAGGEDVLGLAGRALGGLLVGAGRGGEAGGRGRDAVRLRRRARTPGGARLRRRARGARRPADRRGRRVGLLLAPGPATDRRPRAARAHPAPRAAAVGAGRGARARAAGARAPAPRLGAGAARRQPVR